MTIGEIYRELKQAEREWPAHFRSAKEFHYLRGLPRDSDFQALGLFTVIESLATHAPDPKDPTDSLTRQVKSKMNLISKRFFRSLDWRDFFPKAPNGDKVWGALYEYRSKLAHGSEADFRSGRLKVLDSPRWSIEFLKEAAKLLIIQALREPQLISDLKSC